jgi:hypothetical protein
MSKNDRTGSAFPIPFSGEAGSYEPEPGLTKREWFAGQALAGLLARGAFPPSGTIAEVGRLAYDYADVMLDEIITEGR